MCKKYWVTLQFYHLAPKRLTLFVFTAKIIMDRVSDKSKGFGFVTFASEDEAQKALTEMNGKVILYCFPCPISVCVYIYSLMDFDVQKWQSCWRQELNGRVIFVDYAKPRTDFGGGMPIARGPPENAPINSQKEEIIIWVWVCSFISKFNEIF